MSMIFGGGSSRTGNKTCSEVAPAKGAGRANWQSANNDHNSRYFRVMTGVRSVGVTTANSLRRALVARYQNISMGGVIPSSRLHNVLFALPFLYQQRGLLRGMEAAAAALGRRRFRPALGTAGVRRHLAGRHGCATGCRVVAAERAPGASLCVSPTIMRFTPSRIYVPIIGAVAGILVYSSPITGWSLAASPRCAPTDTGGTMAPRKYAASLVGGSQPSIRSEFDVHLIENRLIYVKEQCGPDDIDAKIFLHLDPVDADDLPEHRQQHGFDNLDFSFDRHRARLDGICLAQVPLPEYAITAIRTGQYIRTDDGFHRPWEGEIRLDE